MKRMNVQERRLEVLAETVNQIRERGMAALRISDIAEGMDVSSALIIYHFETKENLLVEALRYAAERDLLKLRRIMRASGSPGRRLMEALAWYAPTGQARGWKLWVDAWSASMWVPALTVVLADLQEQWTRAIAAVIDEAVAEANLPPVESHDAATRLTSFLDGLAVRMLVHKEEIGRTELHNWLVRQVGLELNADAGAWSGPLPTAH